MTLQLWQLLSPHAAWVPEHCLVPGPGSPMVLRPSLVSAPFPTSHGPCVRQARLVCSMVERASIFLPLLPLHLCGIRSDSWGWTQLASRLLAEWILHQQTRRAVSEDETDWIQVPDKTLMPADICGQLLFTIGYLLVSQYSGAGHSNQVRIPTEHSLGVLLGAETHFSSEPLACRKSSRAV